VKEFYNIQYLRGSFSSINVGSGLPQPA